MDRKRRAAPFKVGTRLRYTSKTLQYSTDGVEILRAGLVGTVTETHTGYDQHTHDFGDGLETVPAMSDWSVVTMDGTNFKRAILAGTDDWQEATHDEINRKSGGGT